MILYLILLMSSLFREETKRFDAEDMEQINIEYEIESGFKRYRIV